MFRLLGILVGSVTSIVIILLITGIPEFHLEDPAIDQQRFDAAVEKLLAKKREVEQKVAEITEATGGSTAEQMVAPETGNVAETQEAEPVIPAVAVVEPSIDLQWYSFWNPFRSKLAAGGFVEQLERVTGLDYRVVKTKTGVYEVAFAYDSDAERRNKLSRISAATGLDLPDS